MNDSITVRQAIAAVDQASTRGDLLVATKALADTRSMLAVGKLIEVLGHNNPATAVVATRGLINLGADVVPEVINSLDHQNYSARAWAIAVLAELRDPRSLDALIDAAANDLAPSVRRTALRGLATLRLVGSETTAGMLRRCSGSLVHACSDPEWVVRYAAIFGIEQILQRAVLDDESIRSCRTCLDQLGRNDSEAVMVVRLRARQALTRLTA